MENIRQMFRAEAVKAADRVYESLMKQWASAMGMLPQTPPADTDDGADDGADDGSAPPPAPSSAAGLGAKPPSKEDVSDMLEQIVDAIKRHGGHARTDKLRQELNAEKVLYQQATVLGVMTGRLLKSGQRRATFYSLSPRERGGLTRRPPQKSGL